MTDLRKLIHHKFMHVGYSYEISFDDDYKLEVYLGQYRDQQTPIRNTIRGIQPILDYLILSCISADLYTNVEVLFIEDIF